VADAEDLEPRWPFCEGAIDESGRAARDSATEDTRDSTPTYFCPDSHWGA
jgi:hypothetical protein